ncbi:MAG: DUF935 family protein [Sphingobacteriaceae bacterium]|nr:DUF935 family protein [Sphingobacteriaceae bacterium]
MANQNKSLKTANSTPPIIINQLNVRPIARKTQDIDSWRNALRAAEAQIPRRTTLYNLYEDILIDTRLSSVIDKRIKAITNAEWQCITKDGQVVENINPFIDSLTFETVLEEIMLSKFWGYSALEFNFSAPLNTVASLPRKHLRPKLGILAIEENADTGINIREGLYLNTIMEVGNADDLGLIFKAAPYVIYKRGGYGDWAQFAEIFGMPFRKATYDGYDDEQRFLLERALDEMGGGGAAIIPKGSEIEFIQNSTNSDGKLYQVLVEACNSEITTFILGQTLTTENGGSRAQGDVHKEVEADINKADRRFVRRILNDKLIPILEANGIKTNGGKFKIKGEDEEHLSKKDKLEIDLKLVKDLGLPFDPDYFYIYYGLPKPEKGKAAVTKSPTSNEDKNASTPSLEDNKNELVKLNNQQGDGSFFAYPLQAEGIQSLSTLTELDKLYNTRCAKCNGSIALSAAPSGSLSECIKGYIDYMYKGYINPNQVYTPLYLATANTLMQGVTDSFTQNIKWGEPDNVMLAQLRTNIHAFSAAKCLSQNQAMAALIADETGQVKSFNQYRQDVAKITKLYNEQYLNAEYNTAIASAQSASNWLSHEQNGVEALQYTTAGDNKVRDQHAALDGKVAAINDVIWNTIYPPNAFNCRCHVVPAMLKDESAQTDLINATKKAKITPLFKNNVGKTGLVFKDDHTYFKNTKGKLAELDAVKNYGMRPVKNLYQNNQYPQAQTLQSMAEYNQYWQTMVEQHGINEHDFVLKDKLGNNVLFDSSPDSKKPTDYFKTHILSNTDEKRYRDATNLMNILQEPNEIWCFKHKDKYLSTAYVKYYDDKPYILITNTKGNKIIAKTMYKANGLDIDERKGILLFRN